MTLKQHVKKNPEQTLADIQAEKLIARIVFNSNEMTMYLLRCELLDYVLDSVNGVLRGFAIRVLGTSRFDFRDNTNDGMANDATLSYIINTSTNEDLKAKFSALRNILVNDANAVTFPFFDVTQEDVDKVKAELALYGEQEGNVNYVGTAEYHVKGSNEDVRLTFRLSKPVSVDTEIKVRLLVRTMDTQSFSPLAGDFMNITIPADSNSISRDILNGKKLGRHTKFEVISNVINPFTVETEIVI